MTYTFETTQGQPAFLSIRVRIIVDSYVLTAAFFDHKLDYFNRIRPFMIVPATGSGKNVTIVLSDEQVNAIGNAHYHIRASKNGRTFVLESGSLIHKG